MINEDNLNKMYDGIVEGNQLTTKTLNECGFNSTDLKELIDNKTLERIKRGEYKLIDIDRLLNYGDFLLNLGKPEEALNCYLKCHELDSTNYNVNLRLFHYYIFNNEYDIAKEYFYIMYNNATKGKESINNYYLYLLSMFVILPDDYKKKAKLLKSKDIKNTEFLDNSPYNIIRGLVTRQKFGQALSIYQEAEETFPYPEIVAKTLIIHANQERKLAYKYMINMIKEENFEQLIDYLEFVSECHNLDTIQQNILDMTYDLVEMKETGIIPLPSNADNYSDALKAKDYKKALLLFQLHPKDYNSPIYLLLKKINEFLETQEKLVDFDEESIYKFIYNRMEYLKEFGLILLEPMSAEQLNKVKGIIKRIKWIKFYFIDENDQERMFLVLSNPEFEYLDLKHLVQESNDAYNRHNDDVCIAKYKIIMENFKIKSLTLFRMGISYFRKGYKSVALDYLIAANGLAKKEGLDYDYTSLINNIQNELKIETNKGKNPNSNDELSLKLKLESSDNN